MSLSHKHLAVVRTVRDIGKENRTERRVAERDFLSIERFHGDVGTFPRSYVYPAKCEVASLGVDRGREQAVAACHIENVRIFWRELTEP